jgi:hypothetical protein
MNMPNRASRNRFMRSFLCADVSVSWMEGTGCFFDVSICSPSTCLMPAVLTAVAAMAQPFENYLLDTFIKRVLKKRI